MTQKTGLPVRRPERQPSTPYSRKRRFGQRRHRNGNPFGLSRIDAHSPQYNLSASADPRRRSFAAAPHFRSARAAMTHTPTGSLRGVAKRLQCLRNRNPRIHLPLDDSIVRADEYRYFTEFRSRHAIPRAYRALGGAGGGGTSPPGFGTRFPPSTSALVRPHFGQTSPSFASMGCPQRGHLISADAIAGLKHIFELSFFHCFGFHQQGCPPALATGTLDWNRIACRLKLCSSESSRDSGTHRSQTF